MPATRRNRKSKRRDFACEARGMTVEEASLALAVAPSTIWRLARQGVLRRSRALGRTVFCRDDVEALAARRDSEAAADTED